MAQLTPEQMAQLQQLPPEQRAQVEQKLAAQGGGMGAPQQPQECIFCKIVKGEIPAKIIEQNNDCIAFLDIQPKAAGHTVIVTKAHVGMSSELNEAQKASVQMMIDSISQKIMTNLKASGYITINPNGVSAGQAMPHYAVHLIPTYGAAPDLPIMSILQPVKVPEFMMDSVFSALQGGAQATTAPQANAQPAQNKEGFYF
ncbi:MAG: HIT domain-containing protein [Nanohaloarchaea archaeon]|nr:HIT domain-containing protein [Candidatus Nanohaloarchaea archaeon]